ncbi:dihydrofolate reductase family protein [Streptococcus hongkongensis]
MRELVLFLHSSLDGFVEGPNGAMDIGFVAYNEDLEGFANRALATADTILWGRPTYQMMHSYWPQMINHPDASEHEHNHARWINDVEKVVASTSLDEVTWNNSKLIKDNLPQAILDLKNHPGQDIVVLGSPRLAKELLKLKLVDRIKLTVSPVLLGNGLRLLDNLIANLELVSSETFSSGALALDYRVKKESK